MTERGTPAGTSGGPSAGEVAAVLRSRGYAGLLALAGVIGVAVSVASWCYLELVHGLEGWIYEDLPTALGFGSEPWWWPLPVLLVAGVLVGVAIGRLPGRGGHVPAHGLQAGPPTRPVELPGVLLASLATLGFGLVLGPEAPLIAVGSGLTLLALEQSGRDVPDRARLVLTSAAAFAAISTIFGNPLIGAVLIIEAAGLGGPALPVVLLPGLVASGIGSLVFVGMGRLTGLSSSDYAMTPISLPDYPVPQLGDFAWAVVLAVATAVVVWIIVRIGSFTERVVDRRPLVVVPAVALVIAALAIVFAAITGESANAVLFSGEQALGPVVDGAATLSVATLVALLVFKGLAWGLSLGSARGGPTFPAVFLGAVGGLLAAHLPGFAETPAVAVLIGAACVSVLRLPLSSVVIALLVSQAGAGVAPMVIVGVVVAYIAVTWLSARMEPDPGSAGE